jgi:uncharacterized BrkB/YihY/UPF0761 family membrane protein
MKKILRDVLIVVLLFFLFISLIGIILRTIGIYNLDVHEILTISLKSTFSLVVTLVSFVCILFISILLYNSINDK